MRGKWMSKEENEINIYKSVLYFFFTLYKFDYITQIYSHVGIYSFPRKQQWCMHWESLHQTHHPGEWNQVISVCCQNFSPHRISISVQLKYRLTFILLLKSLPDFLKQPFVCCLFSSHVLDSWMIFGSM